MIPSTACPLMLFLLVLTLAAPSMAQAQPPDGAAGSGPTAASGQEGRAQYDEAEAQAIDRMLICPVCPGETIDQSQVELARQMRARVREMLSQGASRQEVLDFFVDRYGPGVLASPPKSGFNLVAWVVPAVAVVAALVGGLVVIRAMRGHPGPTSPPGHPPDADLEPFLASVDQELASFAPVVPPGEVTDRDG